MQFFINIQVLLVAILFCFSGFFALQWVTRLTGALKINSTTQKSTPRIYLVQL